VADAVREIAVPVTPIPNDKACAVGIGRCIGWATYASGRWILVCLFALQGRDRHRPFCTALVDLPMLVFDPLTGSSYQIALDDRNGKARMKPPGTPYRGND